MSDDAAAPAAGLETQGAGAPPPWWGEFLTHLDGLPGELPPLDLVALLTSAGDEPWKGAPELHAVTWGLYGWIQADSAKEPFKGLEFIRSQWEPFHDDLADRGPVELRARFGDLVWNLRLAPAAARVAIARRTVDAYLVAAPRRAAANGLPTAGDYVRRALGISRQLRDTQLNERAVQVGVDLLRTATTSPLSQWALARLFAEHDPTVAREVAALLERRINADLAGPGCDWEWARHASRVAARAWKKAGEPAAAQRLLVEAARLHVAQGRALDALGASAMLVSDCYARGVRALRDAGQPDEAEQAHRALLAAQARIPAEMKRIDLGTYDLTEQAKRAIATVSGKMFSEQLLRLCAFVRRPSRAALLADAKASHEQFLFHHLVAFRTHDDEGRVLKLAENSIERTVLERAGLQRAYTVRSAIEPMLRQIWFESPGGVSDWIEVLHDRPLIPAERLVSIARGLAAGLASDWMVATHILVPQFEFLVRRLLGEADDLTSTLNADLTQREKLFSELLRRPKLTTILGEDWVFDLTSFLVEPGGNLRNRVAHGMIHDDGFDTVEGPYLWFLVLELILRVGRSDVNTGASGAPSAPPGEDPELDEAEPA